MDDSTSTRTYFKIKVIPNLIVTRLRESRGATPFFPGVRSCGHTTCMHTYENYSLPECVSPFEGHGSWMQGGLCPPAVRGFGTRLSTMWTSVRGLGLLMSVLLVGLQPTCAMPTRKNIHGNILLTRDQHRSWPHTVH